MTAIQELTPDLAAAYRALPCGRENAKLLSHIRLPYGMTRFRKAVHQLQAMDLAGWRPCGTYGDPGGFGRYRAWYRKPSPRTSGRMPPLRPQHLFLGTQLENMADRQRKGRQAKGEDHGRSKLTEEEVEEVRLLHVKGCSFFGGEALGRLYHVSGQTIRNAVRGKTW